jgi:hypothetical protein
MNEFERRTMKNHRLTSMAVILTALTLLPLPTARAQTNCVAPPANLVLWLPFDETVGPTAANLASPLNVGTWENGPTPLLGAYVSNSLCFNGSQYVSVPDYSALEICSNDLTIDAWINLSTNAGPPSPPRVILDKRDTSSAIGLGYSLSIDYAKMILTLGDSIAGISYQYYDSENIGHRPVPADGLWHFVAVSVSQEAGIASFYVDGVLNSVTNISFYNLCPDTNSMWVGMGVSQQWGPNQGWLGCLDEVEVFNRALSSNEVAAIYNAGTSGKCKPPPCDPPPANLVMWLPFDETVGPTAANLASPLNVGTWENGPTPLLGAYVSNSLCFNGSQYVSVPDYPALEICSNDLTIDAWVNLSTNAGPPTPPRVILDKRDTSSGVGYSLSVDYAKMILSLGDSISGVTYQYYDSEGIGRRTLPADGLWHFVAVSVSQVSDTATFYVDGVLNSVTNISFYNLCPETNSMLVGMGVSQAWGPNQPWLGCLDEVEVFNRALSSNEVAAIYNAGTSGKCKPPPCPNLVSSWLANFNVWNNTGQTATDFEAYMQGDVNCSEITCVYDTPGSPWYGYPNWTCANVPGGCVIEWTGSSTAPGSFSHFGVCFEAYEGGVPYYVYPTNVVLYWTANNTNIGYVQSVDNDTWYHFCVPTETIINTTTSAVNVVVGTVVATNAAAQLNTLVVNGPEWSNVTVWTTNMLPPGGSLVYDFYNANPYLTNISIYYVGLIVQEYTTNWVPIADDFWFANVGLPFQITSIARTNVNDVQIGWNAYGPIGCTNYVQITTNITGGYNPSNFADLATNVVSTPTTNYTDSGARTNRHQGFYRIIYRP